MKRIVVIACLWAVCNILPAKVHVQVGPGFDFIGEQKRSNANGFSTCDGTHMGISPYAEVLMPIYPNMLCIGAGTEYQIPRGFFTDFIQADPLFRFIPFYACGKVAFQTNMTITPEFIVHAGYDVLLANDDYTGGGDLSGGWYYAAGMGVVHPVGFTVDVMFRVFHGTNEGTYYGTAYKNEITQTNMTLRTGFRF